MTHGLSMSKLVLSSFRPRPSPYHCPCRLHHLAQMCTKQKVTKPPGKHSESCSNNWSAASCCNTCSHQTAGREGKILSAPYPSTTSLQECGKPKNCMMPAGHFRQASWRVLEVDADPVDRRVTKSAKLGLALYLLILHEFYLSLSTSVHRHFVGFCTR